MKTETPKNQLKGIWAVLVMLTFWVTIHTVKLNTLVPDYSMLNKTVNALMDRVIGVEQLFQEIKSIKDELSPFGQTFKEYREDFGPGATFTWNGDQYTTYLKEELTVNQ